MACWSRCGCADRVSRLGAQRPGTRGRTHPNPGRVRSTPGPGTPRPGHPPARSPDWVHNAPEPEAERTQTHRQNRCPRHPQLYPKAGPRPPQATQVAAGPRLTTRYAPTMSRSAPSSRVGTRGIVRPSSPLASRAKPASSWTPVTTARVEASPRPATATAIPVTSRRPATPASSTHGASRTVANSKPRRGDSTRIVTPRASPPTWTQVEATSGWVRSPKAPMMADCTAIRNPARTAAGRARFTWDSVADSRGDEPASVTRRHAEPSGPDRLEPGREVPQPPRLLDDPVAGDR